ncbi:MAG: hypothetical protein K2H20_01015 [Bacilli bacterium]|nr:hypothetical protein [Bacilli bacterium]
MEEDFKIGDIVYAKWDNTLRGVIVDIDEDDYKYPYTVRFGNSDYTTGCDELDILNKKSALLSRLNDLTEEFGVTDNDLINIINEK